MRLRAGSKRPANDPVLSGSTNEMVSRATRATAVRPEISPPTRRWMVDHQQPADFRPEMAFRLPEPDQAGKEVGLRLHRGAGLIDRASSGLRHHPRDHQRNRHYERDDRAKAAYRHCCFPLG